GQLLVPLERLAADAVVALVAAAVDVAVRAHATDDLLRSHAVTRLRRAHEVIVRDREAVPRLAEASTDAIDPLLGCHARGLCALQVRHPVLVGAEHDVTRATLLALVPRQHVRADLLRAVAEMRRAVRVVAGRGDVPGGFRVRDRRPPPPRWRGVPRRGGCPP